MSPSLLGRRARLLLLVATSMILHSYASLPLLSTMNVYIAQFFCVRMALQWTYILFEIAIIDISKNLPLLFINTFCNIPWERYTMLLLLSCSSLSILESFYTAQYKRTLVYLLFPYTYFDCLAAIAL